MSSKSATATFLHILNTVQVILALALTAGAIWLFVEVQSIAALRNANHYLLDYKVTWPQGIPWVFVIIGMFILAVSCCGFVGAKKKSRCMVLLYVVCQVAAILGLIAAAIVALTCADSDSTDKFLYDTILDAFHESKTDRSVESAFGNIEKRFQCCGANNARDYLGWKDDFPISCCDTYYHGWIGAYNIDCNSTNKLANERHGCMEVAANYARIAIKALAGVSVFTAFIGLLNLIIALALSKRLKKQKPRMVLGPHETESKKVLI